MPDTMEICLAVVTYLAYFQSQYDTFCLNFSFEYLTSAVYISSSDYTLTFCSHELRFFWLDRR